MKIQIIIITGCLALMAGCASSGKNFNPGLIGHIEKGSTTESDLIAWFGSPTHTGIDSETGRYMTWVYSEARVKGETFIPFAGAFVGGTDVKTKRLTVNLRNDGVVSGYNYEGGGLETTGMTQSEE